MFGIGNIKINAAGKTKEEIKKEVIEQTEKEIDKMFEINEKIVKAHKKKEVKEEPLAKLHITLDEVEDKSGFNCEVDVEGNGEELMGMLVCGVATALKEIAEFNPLMAIEFGQRLFHEYMEGEDEDE